MGTRPTFLGFEASKSALYAAQKSLDITGHNLANMSVEGYTRQRVDQVSMGYYCYGTKYNINARKRPRVALLQVIRGAEKENEKYVLKISLIDS